MAGYRRPADAVRRSAGRNAVGGEIRLLAERFSRYAAGGSNHRTAGRQASCRKSSRFLSLWTANRARRPFWRGKKHAFLHSARNLALRGGNHSRAGRNAALSIAKALLAGGDDTGNLILSGGKEGSLAPASRRDFTSGRAGAPLPRARRRKRLDDGAVPGGTAALSAGTPLGAGTSVGFFRRIPFRDRRPARRAYLRASAP